MERKVDVLSDEKMQREFDKYIEKILPERRIC